jgi:predicted O-methyltransferase YrrM
MRELGKRVLRRMFELGQRAGVDILPRHFYSEIPDIRQMRSDSTWRRPYGLESVLGTDLDDQLAWFAETCPPALTRDLRSKQIRETACRENGAVGYGPVESELLYCVVAARRPRRMIQVGAGVSTAIARRAAREHGLELELTCIDPFPTDYLRGEAARGAIDLIAEPVQRVEPARFAALAAGDILFVDSTHTVKPGSDVNFIVLEVLPRLAPGVLVHFHDIMLPFDYGPGILDSDIFFWSETVLVAAYLSDNPRIAIRLCCSMVHHARRAEAQPLLPAYDTALETENGLARDGATGAFPSSLWLEVLHDPA